MTLVPQRPSLGFWLILFLAVAATAHAGTTAPTLIKASSKTRPAWADSTPSMAGKRCFVGTAQKASLAEALQAAAQDAWNQAAQAAGAEVTSSYREQDSTDAAQVQARTQVAAMASIQGLAVEQRYVEEWGGDAPFARVWVLATLPEDEFAQAVRDARQKLEELRTHRQGRRAELEKALAEAQDLILAGRRQAASGFEDRAREDFQRAQGELQLVLGEGAGGDPDVQDRAQSLLNEAATELAQKALVLADFKAAVERLARALVKNNAPAAVVRATYQGSAFGGPMGPRLVKLVEDELARRAPERVIPSATFLARLSALRLPLQDLAGAADPAKIGELGVHSFVYVDYYERPDGVELGLSLQSPASGLLLATSEALLPRSMVGDVPGPPPRLDVAQAALNSFAPAEAASAKVSVKLWPDHGESSTYTEGQLIVLHARVEKPCHLYLVHADSDGSVQLLYPNAWHSGSKVQATGTVDVPADTDSFQFRAVQPYGAEVIVALATLDPLPSLEAQPGDSFASLGKGGQALDAEVRDYRALPPTRRGISQAVYTTVGAKEDAP